MIKSTELKNGFQVFSLEFRQSNTRTVFSGMREGKILKVAHQRRTLRYARKPKPSKLHTREELSGMRESQHLQSCTSEKNS